MSAWCKALSLLAAIAVPAFAANDPGAALAQNGNAHGAPACSACHGMRGEGNPAAGFPRLAGLGQAYLERQLGAFADGQRQNAVMAPIAKALQPDERQAVARYYAALPFPESFTAPSNPSAAGVMLAERGRWENGPALPACVQCHGPNGIGVGESFPPLAGQSATYIASQLQAWQQGTRPAGPLGLMHAIATRLTSADIDAVAQYFGAMKAGAVSKDRS